MNGVPVAGPWLWVLLGVWLAVAGLLAALVAVRWVLDRQARRDQVDRFGEREAAVKYALAETDSLPGKVRPRFWPGRQRRRLATLYRLELMDKWGGTPGVRMRHTLEQQTLMERVQRSGRSWGRTQEIAAEYLARLSIPEGREQLLRLLRDGDRKVRGAAAYGLIQNADPQAGQALLDAVAGRRGIGRVFGSDVGVRMGPPALDAMIAGLDDPRPTVRMVAADVVGQLGAEQAVPTLEALVAVRRQQGDVAVRAAYALGAIGLTRSVPVLAGCLGPGNTYPVQQAAVAALGRIDAPTAHRTLSAYLSADPDLARAAAEALARSEGGLALLARQARAGDQRARVAAWGLWVSEQRSAALANLPISDVAFETPSVGRGTP